MVNIEKELPFKIPNSWRWVRLNHIGRVIGGGTPSTDNKLYWQNGTINWFTPAFMSKIKSRYVNEADKKISLDGLNHSSAVLFSANSIIMSSRAPIGYLCINTIEACTSQGCKSIELYDKSILEFIYLAIKFNINYIISIASGTTFKEISLSKFANILIPLPPVNELHNIIEKYYKIESQIEILNKEIITLYSLKSFIKIKLLNSIFSPDSSYKSYYGKEYSLGEILEYEQPTPYIVNSTDYDNSYKTPVLTPGKSFILGYTNETNGIYKANEDNKVIIFDDFTTSSRLVNFDFKVKSSAMKILKINDNFLFDIEYMYYLLQTIHIIVNTHKRFWISEYAPIKLKIHTIDEQKKIKDKIKSVYKTLDLL